MTKKIIFAGECILALATVLYICSELALAERGYTAVGGEIIGVAVLAFVVFTTVKTVKDIRNWRCGDENRKRSQGH